MVELDAIAVSTGSLTLVGAIVENTQHGPRRIRLTNQTGGTVLAPQQSDVPATSWTEQGVAVDVPAGASCAVGYATPVDPVDQPLSVDEVTRVPESAGNSQRHGPAKESTASNAIVRTLGIPSRTFDISPVETADRQARRSSAPDYHPGMMTDDDVESSPNHLPNPGSTGERGETARGAGVTERDDPAGAGTTATDERTAQPPIVTPPPQSVTEEVASGCPIQDTRHIDTATSNPPSHSSSDTQDADGTNPSNGANDHDGTDVAGSDPANPIESTGIVAPHFLEESTRRIKRAEDLAAARDLEQAAERVDAIGGLSGVKTLADRLERDAADLAEVARRAETLAERAEAVDLPVDVLSRLA